MRPTDKFATFLQVQTKKKVCRCWDSYYFIAQRIHSPECLNYHGILSSLNFDNKAGLTMSPLSFYKQLESMSFIVYKKTTNCNLYSHSKRHP
jgi:hypothetical protein